MSKNAAALEQHELAELVTAVRRALAEAAPTALRATTIPNALSEMAALAEITESAAHQIVSCVDDLRGAGDMPASEYAELVSRNCVQILEACAFQDLAGQRIAKIVSMLLVIEDKLGGLESALGAPLLQEMDAEGDGGIPMAKGPPLPGEGISQDDVDRLFP